MKLVKLGAAAALSTALLASGVTGLNAKAEETTSPKQDGSEEGYERNMGSDSNVNFIPSTGKTDPTDPTDPTNPGKPIPPKEGTEGPLSIDYASDFAFGTQEITTEDRAYFAKPQEFNSGLEGEDQTVGAKETPTFVQISDKRGSNAGWTLNLKQNHQFQNEDAQNEFIEGAELHFLEGEAVSTGTGTKPSTHEAKLDAVGGSYSKIMSAEENEGTGTWSSMFGGADALSDKEVLNAEGEKTTEKRDEGVILTIPGASQTDAVEYDTTLTWQLTNEPGNGEGNMIDEGEDIIEPGE